MSEHTYTYCLKIGKISISENGEAITKLGFLRDEEDISNLHETLLTQRAAAELREYFEGSRTQFSLPLASQGTAFQCSVWEALCTIPYGETRTYAQIAAQIGSPKGYRAVGMANHHNPIAILIPCHRVIGSSGKLVGYAGGLHIKETLLQLEQRGPSTLS